MNLVEKFYAAMERRDNILEMKTKEEKMRILRKESKVQVEEKYKNRKV